jgi:hypothetical protein
MEKSTNVWLYTTIEVQGVTSQKTVTIIPNLKPPILFPLILLSKSTILSVICTAMKCEFLYEGKKNYKYNEKNLSVPDKEQLWILRKETRSI